MVRLSSSFNQGEECDCKWNITMQGSKYYKGGLGWRRYREGRRSGSQPNQEEGNMGGWRGLTQFTQSGGWVKSWCIRWESSSPHPCLLSESRIDCRASVHPIASSVCLGCEPGDWRSKGTTGCPSPLVADQGILFLIGILTGWLASSKAEHLLLGTVTLTHTLRPPFYHRVLSISKYFQLNNERLGINPCLYKQQSNNSRPSHAALVIPLIPTAWPTLDNSFIWNYLFCQALTQIPLITDWWLIIMRKFLASVVIKNVTMNYYFSPVKLAMLCCKGNSVGPVRWKPIAPSLVTAPGTSLWKVIWQCASELNDSTVYSKQVIGDLDKYLYELLFIKHIPCAAHQMHKLSPLTAKMFTKTLFLMTKKSETSDICNKKECLTN